MNFKNWLLTEEIWQNNTATVYHRTKPESIKSILSTSWQTAGGCLYGCGLYTTFSIESQFTSYMHGYGTSILKFKVTNLDQYVICHKSVAQQILGQNYKISDQLKKLNLTNLYKPQQIDQFDSMMETVKFSAELALKMYQANTNLQNKAKGIIYYGSNDGYCLVKYPPIEDGTITLLGYVNDALTNDLQKMQELEANCKKNEQGKCESPWITSTSKVSVKTLYGLEKDKKPDYAKQKIPAFSEILRMQKIDQESWNLFKEKLKSIENRDNILKFLIIKNKLKINDNTTYDLLQFAKNKDEIAKLLGSENISKLSDDDVNKLFKYSENKDEIAKLIIQYKKELTDYNVYNLLSYAENKDEMAKILGSENINKLSDLNFFHLLSYAANKDQMAKLIIQYKTELNDNNVYHLFAQTNDKDKMAKLIIQDKKELTDSDVFHCLSSAKNKDEIAKLLGSENINKLSDGDFNELIEYETNKDQIINVIIKYKTKITYNNFKILLKYDPQNEEILNRLQSSITLQELSDHELLEILKSMKNPYPIFEKMGSNLADKLPYVYHSSTFYDAVNDNAIIKGILQYKKNLDAQQIFAMLGVNGIDLDEIKKYIPKDVLNKLEPNQVFHLINNYERLDVEPMAKLLGPENLTKLNANSLEVWIDDSAREKLDAVLKNIGSLSEKIISQLISISGQYQITDDYNKDELIQKIIQYIPNLSPLAVANMLWYAYDKNEIADALGKENINKLTDEYVKTLMTTQHMHINDEAKDDLKKIFQKYGRIPNE